MPTQFYPMSHDDAQSLITALQSNTAAIQALQPGRATPTTPGLMGPADYLDSNGIIQLATALEKGLMSPEQFEILDDLDNIIFHDGPLTRSAAYHNGAPKRGKSLGDHVTAEQFAAIAAGTFDGMWLGDYWTINGHTHTIVSFDPYWHVGDQSNGVTFHHLGVVSDGGWSSAWFSSNDTSHGYVYTGNGSIRAYIQGTVQPAIITDFGSDHVKSYRALYPTTYSSGVATSWAWTDARVELLDEVEVYGCQVWGSGPYEVGHSARQLDLFRIDPAFKYIRATWWLRSVSSATWAAYVYRSGYADWGNASSVFAVRPLSLIG